MIMLQSLVAKEANLARRAPEILREFIFPISFIGGQWQDTKYIDHFIYVKTKIQLLESSLRNGKVCLVIQKHADRSSEDN